LALGTQQSAKEKPKNLFTAEARRRGEDKTNFLPLMTLTQLIDADKPKTFATQRGRAATKSKVKNFTPSLRSRAGSKVARKNGERGENLTTKEHDVRAKKGK
jgi:hypothetical protein